MDVEANLKESKIVEKLIQRENDRKREQNIKKIANANESENVEAYTEIFLKRKEDILKNLTNFDFESSEKPEIQSHLNHISAFMSDLQKDVSSSSLFLRKYDIKKFEEYLSEIEQELRKYEEKYLPKKKFAFKKKKALDEVDGVSVSVENKVVEIEKVPDIKIQTPTYHTEEYGFKFQQNQTLTLGKDDTPEGCDLNLDDLQNCKIILKCLPNTLHISNLRNCYILTTPVSTSVFIENCENCYFALACQQVRMHTSSNCQIYLHVTSKAIVEYCTKIGVAKYDEVKVFESKFVEDCFDAVGLNKNTNNWDCLDDFNWLSQDKPSPNWFLLENNDKIDWNSVINS